MKYDSEYIHTHNYICMYMYVCNQHKINRNAHIEREHQNALDAFTKFYNIHLRDFA